MREEDLLDSQAKVKPDFKEFDFPIDFRFKLGTISNDFVATDANGRTLAYVRQKMFKLKEAIMVYAEDSKTNLLYKISADRIIDFNASYEFYRRKWFCFGKRWSKRHALTLESTIRNFRH
jgi:uncharacterized protein YxjI